MYNVHMKTVTPSQARKNWFRLLDEAAEGEVIVIERKGRRLVLQREPGKKTEIPSYQGLIEAADVARADAWSWEWSPEGLTLKDGSKEGS